MASPPVNIDQLLRDTRDMDVEGFCSRRPTPYLLVDPMVEEKKEEKKGDWSFDTMHVTLPSTTGGAGASPSVVQANRVPRLVFAVRKDGVDKANLVTIGRARTCDIWLDSKAISKLHAYFSRDPISEAFTVTDAGSTNGTELGGQRLAQGQAVALSGGEEILLAGRYRAVFMLPAQLHAFLRALPVLG